MRTRSSALRWNVALLAASVLVALAFAEAAVRILRPQFIVEANPTNPLFWQHAATGFYRHDPELGWRNIPGAEGTFTRSEFSNHVRINSAGWRDRERSVEKPLGALRMVVLGDSFTWGHGVEDDEIFTRRLEAMMPGLEVLNMGLSGSSTDQQLLILKQDALSYHPDLVLVMICRNDFSGIMGTREGPYEKPSFVLEQDGTLRLINVPVPDVSSIARLHDWFRRHLALWNITESVWQERQEAPQGPTGQHGQRQDSYDLMRALLKTMRDVSASAGAGFRIGIVPSNAHTYVDPTPPREAERVRVIEELGKAEGIPVLNLVPAFRAAARDPATGARIDLHYRVDQHWNRLGHEVAAAELARLLREDRLVLAARSR